MGVNGSLLLLRLLCGLYRRLYAALPARHMV
jgi:hypothetical protein